MSEFTIEPQPLVDENPNTDQVFKNVKEIKVGNGRWKQDKDAIRGYDENGVCKIFISLQ
jgi:hypothetical protein